MNLLERERAWGESPVRRVQQLPGSLSCGPDKATCLVQQCAYYDPERQECSHVLKAKAIMGAAESLAQLVEDREPKTDTLAIIAGAEIRAALAAAKVKKVATRERLDITDAARALHRGCRVRRAAWDDDKVVWFDAARHGVFCRHCDWCSPVMWAPSIEDLLAVDYVVEGAKPHE